MFIAAFPEVVSIYGNNSLNSSVSRDNWLQLNRIKWKEISGQLYIKTHWTPCRRRQLHARQVWHGRMLPHFLGHRYQSSLEKIVYITLQNYRSAPQLLQYNNWKNNNTKGVKQRRAFIKTARAVFLLWGCLFLCKGKLVRLCHLHSFWWRTGRFWNHWFSLWNHWFSL